MGYCFVQDDSCNWYIIPHTKRDSFMKLCEIEGEELEEFQQYSCDCPSNYIFSNVKDMRD